ncbi:DNA polymerase III subunit gamma and tau [Georgenia sp. TF02-10]|uniref:DNA polymerase III subunit gamma and tau n=1 Tax=Georgenia sp. TF02-10 TaxID=2917725 RepID=UPI001FA73569|nr:DNA polymerase III subunit gamma and tau [Georgenia sp. TF02-10]UNX55217.1 DNA polymerase III subunit gamma and tau [Georgenia sp. TF02-10]
MTTALYRRYRPETFQEVIGQEHVTEPLMAALRGDRVTHAYLFSGPRGCGKTTSARILARCLNCAEGPTDTPCGRCPSCLELARSGPGSLDVVELDAASHGGVDDARDLRERASFAPARDRYKVFIVDEAHMVSSAGFNALLKIVEEPPPHVKFIFATTEPDKVIGTIRSRTHHYPFRLVPPQQLLAYLEQLCAQEGVRVGAGVLPMVVRAGGGSVRDTLSVLDQLIAGAQHEELDYARAVALLGYTDAALLDDVVDSIAARDGATLFRVVDRVVESGHDPRRFVEDLLQRLRDLVVLALAGEQATAALPGVPADQLDRMRTQAHHLGPAQLSRAADLVNAALTEMVGATSPRLQLELLCARILLPAADPGDAGYGARLDRLEHQVAGAPGPSRPAGGGAGQPGRDAGPAATGAGAEAAAGAPAPVVVASPADGARSGAAGGPVRGTTGRAGTAQAGSTDQPGRADAGTADRPGTPDAGATDPADRADAAGPGGTAPAGTGAAEAGGGRPAPRAHAVSDQAPDPATAPAAAAAAARRPAPTTGTAPPAEAAPATADPAGDDAELIRRRWPEVVATLARLKRTSWILVSQNAQAGEVVGGALQLIFSTPGLATAFRGGQHAEHVQRALNESLGVRLRVEAVVRDAPGPAQTAGAGPAGAPDGGGSVRDAARSSWGGPAQPAATAPRGRTAWPEPAGRPASSASAPSPAAPTPAASTPSASSPSAPTPGSSSARPAPRSARTPPAAGPSGQPTAADPDDPYPLPPEPPEDPGESRTADAPGEARPADVPDGAWRRPEPPSGRPTPATRPAPRRVVAPADDVASLDDPDAEGSGLVGVPLLAQMLGGTVIEEITMDDGTPGAP